MNVGRDMLSDEQIKKFQKLYQKRFGKKIEQKDAYEQGIRLIQLMSLIYRPMTEKEYLNLKT